MDQRLHRWLQRLQLRRQPPRCHERLGQLGQLGQLSTELLAASSDPKGSARIVLDGVTRNESEKHLVAVDIPNRVCVTWPVEMPNASVPIVSQVVGDLAAKAPSRTLANVLFPSSVAIVSLSPSADSVDLSDNAFDHAEGVFGLGSSTFTDPPPSVGGVEQLVRRH